ncbi:MAG: hypothetical protein UT05_C0004G0015 [Parcubacteria group bacterium GW2011_GWF2_38_76]|nr:MAG: hypothetical protein UT05_C0004G0015 [Parcubacteria group bacterium GW2011_GWF2_38_76]HBM45679.1 hypothetical protein [Patescibacteria group bacterium]
MKRKNIYILSIAILALFSFLLSGNKALADLSPNGGPTGVSPEQQGPSDADKAQVEGQAKSEASARAQSEAAAARAQFESEFGAPPEAYQEHKPQKPQIEKPGKVPEEARKYLTDAEIVPIYCAMAKWKTGMFFSAMNSLKNNLAPKMEQAKSILGITTNIPSFDDIQAEGQRKIDDICNAKTVADAEKVTEEFSIWGEEIDSKYIGTFMSEFEKKMKEKGDELRKKIEDSIQPTIDEESKKMEPEIDAEARRIAGTFKFTKQPTDADIAAMRAQIEERLKPIIEAKKQEITQKVQAKIEEVKQGEAGKFIELGKLFEGIDGKIQADINAGLGAYDKYKEEAFNLRREMVMKVLDKNLEDGLKKLDASEKDIEAARKDDPTIKNVASIKAELNQDKKVLADRLDVALEAGDENAFQNAINEFKMKWETMRAEGEKAMQQSVSKVCTTALAKFQGARAQMQTNIKKVDDIQAKCAGSASDDCLKVNQFSGRFETLSSKMSELLAGMNMAENMCKDEEKADIQTLISLMRKIQSDGEDLKVFGEALEVEKSKAIADSAEAICGKVLPQLNAYETEVTKNDLSVLKNNLAKCVGNTSEDCDLINKTRTKYEALNREMSAFSTRAKDVSAFCSNPREEDFEKIGTSFNTLKEDGEKLKLMAKELQEEQATTISERAICKAVLPQTESAKADISVGIKKISDTQNACNGKNDEKCVAIQKLQTKFDEIKTKSENIINKFGNIKNTCDSAKSEKPSGAFLKAIETSGLKEEGEAIKKLVREMEELQTKASLFSPKGVKIEAEDEIAKSLLPKTADWHSREETNPSWRPPYYGSGVWYLSRGKESLSYRFELPISTHYYIWVRDYVDNFQAKGIRRATYYINGNKIVTAPEISLAELSASSRKIDPAKGIFGWHKIAGPIKISGGANTLKVEKEATTAGAAILDAFYITSGNEVPPER